MVLGLLLLDSVPSWAGQAPQAKPRVFTVPEAVAYALTNYPAVRAAFAAYNAARAQIGLTRTSYLPLLYGVAQGERETRNSVYGVLMPQFPTILTGTQGTVFTPSNATFWTSGVGELLAWEPFTFGYRRSELRAASATARRTASQVTLTQLGVATAVADAALGLLATEQRVQASMADVQRRTVFDRSVHALVDAKLRPGADASRADAELATARTGLILDQQAEQVASASLAEALGLAGSRIEITPRPFLATPPTSIWEAPPLTQNPAAVVEQRRILEAKSSISVLNHALYPDIVLEGLNSARGSGQLSATKKVLPGLQGLDLTAHNWQAGLTVQFDFTSILPNRAQKKIAVATLHREQALYDETMQQLTGQEQEALATLDGARRVAQNTPVELEAARQSEAQALARFNAGVGTIVDVAEAQRLLVQAETDDSLARLGIWRALADLAAAEGDLTPFLNLARTMSPGAP
jgi:outer membrane protein